MMIANVLNARLLANGVVEVHGAPARDEKDVAHAPIRELPDDVVRKLHERRTSERTSERTPDWRSEFECGSSERTELPSPRPRISVRARHGRARSFIANCPAPQMMTRWVLASWPAKWWSILSIFSAECRI